METLVPLIIVIKMKDVSSNQNLAKITTSVLKIGVIAKQELATTKRKTVMITTLAQKIAVILKKVV
jgi:hypothetical protein